jgi:uncharacterized Fe-S cluster-containing radical SAM superfamily protein
MVGDAFRFSLKRPSDPHVLNINDMFGMHLRELLDLLIPLKGDQHLMVDGYRLLNDRNTIQPLYAPQERGSEVGSGPLDLYEPRIGYIQHLLESLLSLIDLEVDGETVKVDGFRLKNLNRWLTPGGGALDILAHAASTCNLSCRFCYNKNSPQTLRPGPRDPEVEHQEIQERIRHYVPSAKLNIFPNMGSPAEALAHPHILDIMTELRKKTDELFRLSTNGSTLTLEMIKTLSKLKPIYLDISINSSSSSRREWLMGDPESHIALTSLQYLKAEGIPYTVVVVPWPFPSRDVMLKDLKETVDFARAFDPALIQVNLPGYAQIYTQKELFPHDEVWNELKSKTQELRNGTDCPLVIRPGLFEEYKEPNKVNDPVLIGVIKNSPTQFAGLLPGDRIIKVNGLPVKNRPQARSLLSILHESEMKQASLSIQRDGTRSDLELDLSKFDYPYTRESATHLGVVFASSGIPQDWLERLKQVIITRGAKEVLLLSSSLVRPALARLMSERGIAHGVALHIRVPRNGYFGGNVYMGDLMVVEDFIEAVEAFIKEGGIRPDLVVIPSSPFHLSGWGRDLTGRVYLDIERHTKVPVALVECEPIFD